MSQQSPIIAAIRQVEEESTGEIRVHLSKKWLEKDPYARATRLFHHFEMFKTPQRNAILLYVNLKRRKFALVGDEGIQNRLSPRFWDEAARNLKINLISTHPENAIALSVREIGEVLRKYSPALD